MPSSRFFERKARFDLDLKDFAIIDGGGEMDADGSAPVK
jgi:hypothetical protein